MIQHIRSNVDQQTGHSFLLLLRLEMSLGDENLKKKRILLVRDVTLNFFGCRWCLSLKPFHVGGSVHAVVMCVCVRSVLPRKREQKRLTIVELP